MTMLEHALSLAKKGLHVFPVKENAKFPPLIKDFPTQSSDNPKTITDWWANGHGSCNPAVSTTCFKEREALIVVDIDQKEGKMGEDELIRLELEGMDFPTTYEVSTPSGGRHLYYYTDEPVKQGVNVLAPGIDIRSRGGYVVGAGSVLSNGKYKGNDREIARAPQWLVSYCGRSTPKPEGGTAPGAYTVNPENALSRARHYLEVEAPIAIQGAGGNQTTFAVAARTKDFGIGREDCFTLMSDHWNDRCTPPWDDGDLAAIVVNAYKYGEKPQGIDSPEATFKPIPQEQSEKPKQKGLYGEPFKSVEPNLHQVFLVDKTLSPNAMSVVYGESNSGKTFFALDLGLHISLGQEWHTRKTTQGLVIYVAAEGGWGIRKRIKAFRQYHNLDGKDVPFVLVPCPVDLLNPKAHAEELVELIRLYETQFDQKACLIIIDTLARAMAGGNENAPNDMGAFVKNVDRVRQATQSHMMIIHHSGKDTAKGARGHSSLRGATDTEIEIADLVARIRKQRDMEFGPSIGFKLEQIQIGIQPSGEPVYSCVVLPSNTSAVSDFSKEALDPASLAGKGFKALQNALDWKPHTPPNYLDLDTEQMVVNLEAWREEFYKLAYPGQTKKKSWNVAFNRSVDNLKMSGHVKTQDIWAWIE